MKILKSANICKLSYVSIIRIIRIKTFPKILVTSRLFKKKKESRFVSILSNTRILRGIVLQNERSKLNETDAQQLRPEADYFFLGTIQSRGCENSRRYRGEGVRLINDHASRKEGGREGWKRGQKRVRLETKGIVWTEGCLRPLSRSKKWNTWYSRLFFSFLEYWKSRVSMHASKQDKSRQDGFL